MNKYTRMFATLLVIGLVAILTVTEVSKSNQIKQAKEEQKMIIQAELEAKEKISEKNKEDEVIVGLNVGNYAPEFELTTIDGETKNLSDYRGEVVFLNFWGSWCPPCRDEMPDLEKFHKETDAVVLGVNLTGGEANKENVKKFIDEFGITFPIMLDQDLKVAERYSIKPIPTSYLIDAHGVIQNMAFGPLTYDMMLEEYERILSFKTKEEVNQ